tara:strand:- start:6516 stop:7037 length:522 start_codon:yes stop_codon:yes gene_type:complete
MQVFDRYTDDIFIDYIDNLKVGDEVLVKCNGHEFVKYEIEEVDRNEIVTVDYVFDEEGFDERNNAEIMLPTTKTMHQWKVCEERKALTDRFLDACEDCDAGQLTDSDLCKMIEILPKYADYSKLDEIAAEDLHLVLDVFTEIVDPGRVVAANFADLNIITKIMESGCPSLNQE